MSGQAQQPDDENTMSIDDEMNADGGTDSGNEATEGAGETDLAAALANAETKAAENWDKYLRAVAELDNVRKRAARDVEKARKFALENFSRDLLAVTDSLEMGIQAAENADLETLLAGKEATLKLLTTTLERFGIEAVDPIGEPFDPEFHEAMTMQPSTESEPGSVLTVIQKGYSLNGRLLRPAMVVVAAEPATPAGDKNGAENSE